MDPKIVSFLCYVQASILSLFLCIGLSDQRAVSLNHKKLFHDLISGQGLYSSEDKVLILNATNFNSSVIMNPNQALVVEFYNAWCGHCIRYAPTWKNFARNIHNWKDVVTVGAVDCSAEINGQLCRDYEVMAYPTLRYFPPNSPFGFYGDDMKRMFNINDLRHTTIEAMEKSVSDNRSGASWPDVKATENLTEALAELPSEVEFIAIMFDKLKSFVGAELILDFHKVQKLKIFSVLETDSDSVKLYDVKEFPSLYVKQSGSSKLTQLPVRNTTREDFYDAMKDFLGKNGISVPKISPSNAAPEVLNPQQIFDIISQEQTLSDDKVYQLDLEMALRHVLFHELRMRKEFAGESLHALKHVIRVIARYFPVDPTGKALLQQFSNDVWNHPGSMTIDQYNKYVEPFEKETSKYLLSPGGYMNCAKSSTKPPCSLWLLFHTLTVQADAKHEDYNDSDPLDVLRSMAGYVKNFFGCTECAHHFLGMAATMPSEVVSFNKSILWLWNAHNKVNARLSNDSVGGRLKIQFPSAINCPKCRNGNEWNEEEVLDHLKSVYTKISYHPLPKVETTESPSHRMNDAVSNDEIGYREEVLISSSVNINFFDIGFCIGLYAFSATVLLFICIKFLVKRGNRKKFNPFLEAFGRG
ncbi:unnamed protein product [Bemisia tabaci]|uniref:Sulfhydryl oxidase n=1 Tax=Bemisia tabaci TaxID=7038 RepID=A0A9P0A343_BEMTA|nr:unnamed protein product [Bemisia tabaci]